jgi:hypothetical protein
LPPSLESRIQHRDLGSSFEKAGAHHGSQPGVGQI